MPARVEASLPGVLPRTMLVNRRCTICHRRVESADLTRCETCDRNLHESCAAFEQKYNCPLCAEERDVGAQEF